MCSCVTSTKAGRLRSVNGHCFAVTFYYVPVLCNLDLDSIEFKFGLWYHGKPGISEGRSPGRPLGWYSGGGVSAASLYMALLRHLRGSFAATDCPPAV